MSDVNAEGIDHVSIAVGDLESAVDFFTEVLGMHVAHAETNVREGVRETMLMGPTQGLGSGAAVQLISPVPSAEEAAGQTGVSKFLADRGDGLHHLAIRVTNVAEAAAAARKSGVRVLTETPQGGTDGSKIVFLHPKDCFGVLIELVENST
jgi:methylmalonyl-CoA/ethylmalonyl-CoA epimerase